MRFPSLSFSRLFLNLPLRFFTRGFSWHSWWMMMLSSRSRMSISRSASSCSLRRSSSSWFFCWSAARVSSSSQVRSSYQGEPAERRVGLREWDTGELSCGAQGRGRSAAGGNWMHASPSERNVQHSHTEYTEEPVNTAERLMPRSKPGDQPPLPWTAMPPYPWGQGTLETTDFSQLCMFYVSSSKINTSIIKFNL